MPNRRRLAAMALPTLGSSSTLDTVALSGFFTLAGFKSVVMAGEKKIAGE
jgi:hypothetical protein